jgi:hypothetical protein
MAIKKVVRAMSATCMNFRTSVHVVFFRQGSVVRKSVIEYMRMENGTWAWNGSAV